MAVVFDMVSAALKNNKYSVWIALLCNFTVCQAWAYADAPDLFLLDAIVLDAQVLAVGEHGRIVSTQDHQTWQSIETDIDVLLTAISSNQQGSLLVVGHDATILHSADHGRSWRLVHKAIDYQAPLLDVAYLTEHKAIAVGAYGLLLSSDDGGLSWQESSLKLTNAKDVIDKFPIDLSDLHLNAIACDDQALCVIAAEAGYVFVSQDHGRQWQVLESPYQGSFFGAEILADGRVLVYGLRGTAYKLAIRQTQWQVIELPADQLLHASMVSPAGAIYLVGNGASILRSNDQGKSFEKIFINIKSNLTSIIAINNKRLMLTTEDGVHYLH